jgi:hypothetical protein
VLRLVFADGRTPAAAHDRQVVISDPDGVPLVFGWRDGRDCWLAMPGRASFKFRPGSQVVTAYPDPGAAPEDVMDGYHGSVLPVVVQTVLEGQAVHASAVVTPAGSIVAFCGASHAGKTTIAVGLSRRGCGLWADDAVAFEARPEGLSALRLPFELNLREESAAHFESGISPGSVDPNGHAPEWTRARLAGFCVLERVEEEPESHTIDRLASSDALVALLGQSFRFKPQAHKEKRRMMRDYLEAVTQAPVFRVRYRAGFETLPEVIDQIEAVVLEGVAG